MFWAMQYIQLSRRVPGCHCATRASTRFLNEIVSLVEVADRYFVAQGLRHS
jgi:hypothetical protein